MGNYKQIEEIYLKEREALIKEVFTYFEENGAVDTSVYKTITSIFWHQGYAENKGFKVASKLFFEEKYNKFLRKIDILGFGKSEKLLEKVKINNKKYLRLEHTTNWILELSKYNSFEDYFAEFSKKKRKNLRWQLNTCEKNKFNITKLETKADFELFLEVYKAQFDKSSWLELDNKKALINVFLYFQKQGLNHSFILKDSENKPISACLGYFVGETYNLYMLARIPKLYDKLSPSNYLVFKLIKENLEKKISKLFVFGPGYYQYKKTFKAKSYPVYIYEKYSLKNILKIVKLLNKYRKLKRK